MEIRLKCWKSVRFDFSWQHSHAVVYWILIKMQIAKIVPLIFPRIEMLCVNVISLAHGSGFFCYCSVDVVCGRTSWFFNHSNQVSLRPNINQNEIEEGRTATVQLLISVHKMNGCDNKYIQIKCEWFLIFTVISIHRISEINHKMWFDEWINLNSTPRSIHLMLRESAGAHMCSIQMILRCAVESKWNCTRNM